MSKRNRERRERNKGVVNYGSLANAVHRVVCDLTGNDGYKDCLTYAIVGCSWLNQHTKLTHAVGGGYFTTTLKRGLEVAFEHFWIMRGSVDNWTHIDLATRHNPNLIRNGFAKAKPDETLEPDAFDEKAIGVPFYVGSGHGLPWKYEFASEPTLFALREYRQVDKLDCVRRVDLILR